MTIDHFSEENGTTIFVLRGRLDTATANILDGTFAAAFGGGARRFVWDLADLDYISSAGLRSVLQALKRVNAHEGRLVLCSLRPMVLEVFEISGFKSLMKIQHTRADAMAAVI